MIKLRILRWGDYAGLPWRALNVLRRVFLRGTQRSNCQRRSCDEEGSRDWKSDTLGRWRKGLKTKAAQSQSDPMGEKFQWSLLALKIERGHEQKPLEVRKGKKTDPLLEAPESNSALLTP